MSCSNGVTGDLSSLKLPDVVTRVQKLDKEAALAAVHEIIDLLNIDFSELQSIRKDNPLFSGATWKAVAPQFDLDPNRGISQLAKFDVPSAILPLSFHRGVMTESLKWLDVYQARDVQEKEAARVRLMDAWHVPVCALFKGRLVDKPGSPMLGTAHTSGGEVEHEVSMAEGILLDLTELKLYFKSEKDHLAQVLLQLASAFRRNSGRSLDPQPPVYAILTDLEKFYYLRYDGSKFTQMSKITVNSDTQDGFLFGMARVSERLFSLLLHAYIGVLTAVETKRSSTDRWSQALTKALSAQNILSTCQRQPMEEWEKAEEGLKVLSESVRYLDKIGSEEECDDNEIGQYIGNILSRMTKDLKVVEAIHDIV